MVLTFLVVVVDEEEEVEFGIIINGTVC